jgi:hypothetical protein
MDRIKAIAYARSYLHGANIIRYPKGIEEYRLHRQLQYLLCGAVDNLMENFGEVTRRDVAYIVESWIITQGTRGAHNPLQPAHGIGEDSP